MAPVVQRPASGAGRIHHRDRGRSLAGTPALGRSIGRRLGGEVAAMIDLGAARDDLLERALRFLCQPEELDDDVVLLAGATHAPGLRD